MLSALLLLWLLALGCGDGLLGSCRADPQTRARLAAADAWDRGKALLDAGEHAAAAEAFAQAEAQDPSSPVLPAWRARALELGGDEAAALGVLEDALGRFPKDTTLRFNRAGLRARRGDLDGAAADVHLLLSAGAIQPEDAGSDLDLVALRRRPELAALVAAPVIDVDLVGEQGSVLLGDGYDAEVLLDHPEGSALSVRDMSDPPGLLRRLRVVEDVLEARPGRARRRLSLTWRAVAPGSGTLGPWLITAGATSGLSERIEVQIVEVGNRSGQQGPAAGETLVLPSQEVGERAPPWVGEIDGDLVVLLPLDASVEVSSGGGALAPRETWELRERGKPRWQAVVFDAPDRALVVATVGRRLLLEQDWSKPAEDLPD